jgi:hypothetical protein
MNYFSIGREIMKFGITIVSMLFLVLALPTGFTTAQDEPATTQFSTEPDPTVPKRGPTLLTMTPEQAQRLSPLHQEMRKILIAEKNQLTELFKEFARETDSQGALAVQRRIHQVKTETEISLLTAQAKSARSQGRKEDAERMEEAIKRITNPHRGSVPAALRAER